MQTKRLQMPQLLRIVSPDALTRPIQTVAIAVALAKIFGSRFPVSSRIKEPYALGLSSLSPGMIMIEYDALFDLDRVGLKERLMFEISWSRHIVRNLSKIDVESIHRIISDINWIVESFDATFIPFENLPTEYMRETLDLISRSDQLILPQCASSFELIWFNWVAKQYSSTTIIQDSGLSIADAVRANSTYEERRAAIFALRRVFGLTRTQLSVRLGYRASTSPLIHFETGKIMAPMSLRIRAMLQTRHGIRTLSPESVEHLKSTILSKMCSDVFDSIPPIHLKIIDPVDMMNQTYQPKPPPALDAASQPAAFQSNTLATESNDALDNPMESLLPPDLDTMDVHFNPPIRNVIGEEFSIEEREKNATILSSMQNNGLWVIIDRGEVVGSGLDEQKMWDSCVKRPSPNLVYGLAGVESCTTRKVQLNEFIRFIDGSRLTDVKLPMAKLSVRQRWSDQAELCEIDFLIDTGACGTALRASTLISLGYTHLHPDGTKWDDGLPLLGPRGDEPGAQVVLTAAGPSSRWRSDGYRIFIHIGSKHATILASFTRGENDLLGRDFLRFCDTHLFLEQTITMIRLDNG